MPQRIIDLLKQGAEANTADKFRQGNVICLPTEGSLVISGDIHGHRRNFERITAFADLDNIPDRHVILQEIIHGGQENPQGECLSYELLFDAARYKVKHPDRVHIIMGNHDTAFITDGAVMKDGREMNESMLRAMKRKFGRDNKEVEAAIKEFLFSQPLAVKCANRILISHSLPANNDIGQFDVAVLDRKLSKDDLIASGSVYVLAWGRHFSQKTIEKMSKLLDVDVFVVGHQPQEKGWTKVGDNLIIIASDHNHGCLLSVDLSKSYSIEKLAKSVIALSSIA